jgi:hypothetical protein
MVMVTPQIPLYHENMNIYIEYMNQRLGVHTFDCSGPKKRAVVSGGYHRHILHVLRGGAETHSTRKV